MTKEDVVLTFVKDYIKEKKITFGDVSITFKIKDGKVVHQYTTQTESKQIA